MKTFQSHLQYQQLFFHNRQDLKSIILTFLLLGVFTMSQAQISDANRSGFTWISKENVQDNSFGAGFTLYSAAWPFMDQYPGASGYQLGLAGSWMSTQRTGSEPQDFYTTIEGGLGWWGDTRFGTETPKFIMGGVSHNFFAWANGTGAGRSNNLPNGQRDWSTPGGKYGVAQLSNHLLWAPDGLNMAQGLNGELLGYGYAPLPITDPMEQTAGVNIATGNQCWTLFLNSTNFKGPATFFLPTFWTEPVLENPSLEGLFLDSRPSNPNVSLGLEHADTPALISTDGNGNKFAKMESMQMPLCGQNNSMLMHGFSVYDRNSMWDKMEVWFEGGEVVSTEFNPMLVPFTNNGGFMAGEISQEGGGEYPIDLTFMDNVQQSENTIGYSFDLNQVTKRDGNFHLPEYYMLDNNDSWQAIKEEDIPASTNLIGTPVPFNPRPEFAYLTPLEPDCAWQDPNGPWNSPGPSAGPFTADLGDGSTVTYYWYRFIDQPSIIHANYPEEMRQKMQERVELIHTNWNHTDDYLEDPTFGTLATVDPGIIVNPPAGLEIGYVPIVTRQEKTPSKLRVFVLAGQSNMQGQGTVNDENNNPGSLIDVVENDTNGNWSEVGNEGAWSTLDDAYLYYEGDFETIKSNVTVGQGADNNLIGPELMFAHRMDKFYDDPILIIKTAWGGKSLAKDFRPPSAGGTTGEFYNLMIDKVNFVIDNIDNEFPDINESEIALSGFAWFQGWNDGEEDAYLIEYESNLGHLINDVRNDLGVSDLPFVIASAGHGGYLNTSDGWVNNMQEIVAVAQENVGCDDDAYQGKVGFVDTKRFYKEANESPEDGVFHYHNNAETFLNVGREIGNEMIKAIGDMAYCNAICDEDDIVPPDLVSIGNRVWFDHNRNGINDPNEPGIPGVSMVIWSDTDGDGIPDWQGFGGVEITDEEGYYRFEGLSPGNYVVFVWQVDNWGVGEALDGYLSTTNFVADADNNIDLDNNGSGNPFTDIFSGIVTLGVGEEPIFDGDPQDDPLNPDANGNATIDFGFYNPSIDDIDGDGFGFEEDCDDFNPNINPDQMEIVYNGLDDDCDPLTLDDDLDQDGFPLSADCDDTNPDVFPFQTEIPYNGIDDDCNPGTLDDDLDQDGFVLADDCDDTNESINPDATDIPNNNIDEDCDGMDATDIVDSDGDGFDNTVDCNDNNPNVNPGQSEIVYNGIDDDCDPLTLDDDLDQDGFDLVDDCDDNNAAINPAVAELVYNGIDDDCNPLTLDDDLDQDGFDLVDDCDDNNAAINPAVAELVYNAIDDDCDPTTLDDDLDQDGFDLVDDCDDNNAAINPAVVELVYNAIDDDCDPTTLDDDLDQDGFDLVDDCDDNNAAINPAVVELVYNGIDDDCDPTTLDDDLDQDGFDLVDDCDDNNANINPDATDIPNNGIDEDCDGMDLISSTYELSGVNVRIYPNPATRVINIETEKDVVFQISLYNLQGKKIAFYISSDQIAIDNIASGTYLLVITDENSAKRITKTIVINN